MEKLESDRPLFHWGGTRRWDTAPETLRNIRDSLSESMRTLETGRGASPVVFAASGAWHTAISPTSDEHARVRSYLMQNGIDDSRVRFATSFSDDLLPRLFGNPNRIAEWEAWYDRSVLAPPSDKAADEALFKPSNGRTLDFVFLDGAHSFPYPAVDWHYSANVLKLGGRMLLDDIPIPAVACVYRYMMSDPCWKLLGIYDNRAASFELVAEPAPEDWTLQPYNRHPYFGFLPGRKRVHAWSMFELERLRQHFGERVPGLQRLRGRLFR